jgi:hypothetical protein
MNEEQQEQQLEENIYEQRFRMLMKLIRIDRMLKGAKITHKKIPDHGPS